MVDNIKEFVDWYWETIWGNHSNNGYHVEPFRAPMVTVEKAFLLNVVSYGISLMLNVTPDYSSGVDLVTIDDISVHGTNKDKDTLYLVSGEGQNRVKLGNENLMVSIENPTARFIFGLWMESINDKQ